MKKLLWLVLLTAFSGTWLLTLGGCAMSQADREFYGGHWVHPTELDEDSGPPDRNGMPDNPVDSQ